MESGPARMGFEVVCSHMEWRNKWKIPAFSLVLRVPSQKTTIFSHSRVVRNGKLWLALAKEEAVFMLHVSGGEHLVFFALKH